MLLVPLWDLRLLLLLLLLPALHVLFEYLQPSPFLVVPPLRRPALQLLLGCCRMATFASGVVAMITLLLLPLKLLMLLVKICVG